jgi:hypothetical protein
LKTNKTENIQFAVLQYYFVSGVFEGIVCLAILLSIPTDPKNAWFFGYSKTRFGMVVAFVVIIISFLALSIKAFSDRTWAAHVLQRTLSLFERYRLLIFSAIGLVFLGTFSFALLRSTTLVDLEGILQRIFPFVLFATTRAVQTILLFVVISGKPRGEKIATPGEVWSIPIRLNKVTRLLFGFVAFFLLAGIVSFIVSPSISDPTIRSIAVRFNLDQESTFPAYFTSVLLLISASLLWVIVAEKRRANDPFALHWLILSIGFLYLSLDEAISLHEILIELVDSWIRAGGIFYYSWVVVAIPLVILFAVYFSGFLFHLPVKTRNRFLLAGGLYVAGAFGFELVGGWFADQYGIDHPIISVLTIIEETIEMVGIVIFIHALLEYIRENSQEIKINFGKENQPEESGNGTST